MTLLEISAKYDAAMAALAVKQAACKPHHLPKKGEAFSDWSPEYSAVLDACAEVGYCLWLFEQANKKSR